MECTGLDLLKDQDKISGMVAMWRETGQFVIFKTKAVILATGGAGKAWKITSNSWEYTGDGSGMAYEAGAELIDMEFTQFHPTGMVWPPSVRGILVTEGVRGEGGILINSEAKRFMFDNIPERFIAETAETEEEAGKWLSGDKDARRPPELLTRDVVARAIRKEVKEGRGSPHGGAFLDIASRRSAEDIKKKLPSMYHQFKVLAELDITTEPMEVGPTLHYCMGGVKVDADSQMSTVQGLFACGECSGGMHGANRLGGNSLSDLLVFGKLAGDGVFGYINALSTTPSIEEKQALSIIRNATEILNRVKGENPYLLHEDLQEAMQNNVGIVRSEELLREGLAQLDNLRRSVKNVKAEGASQFNPGWHEAIALRNLLITAEATAKSALTREESRGAHTRIDFPDERDNFLNVNVVTYKGEDGSMKVKKANRIEPSVVLNRIANLSIEELEQEIKTKKI
jgi:succinate dehydrogenase / fumarate reductase flavoprotein subunit